MLILGRDDWNTLVAVVLSGGSSSPRDRIREFLCKTWNVHRHCNGSVVKGTLGALVALTGEDARHAAPALVDAFHGEGDPELPQQRHPACSRPSSRRFGGAGRCCPLLPRMRTQEARWGEPKSLLDALPVSTASSRGAVGPKPRNPRTGIARYRRPPHGRLLGADDLAKLGAVLRQREADSPVCVTAVCLLLLTWCRPGEIRCLRWCEVKPDRLTLIDAKTGPRHVLLGEAAPELLDSLAETASGRWVFPGGKGNGPLSTNDLWAFWTRARDAAGIVADARPHDLRHAHASHAVMNGESLHITGRLLGHRWASTTNRYVHLNNPTLSHAAERVTVAIKSKFQFLN